MSGATVHVLVLEDDEGLLALAGRVLRKQGYRVTAVADAESAQAAVQQDRPDLLIVDYNLQALDSGLDFFRSLRAAGMGIPAIMVSGMSDEMRIIEALRAGVADVLPKTSDYLDHLPQCVQRVLAQQRQAGDAGQIDEQVRQLQAERDALLAEVQAAQAEIERLRSARDAFLRTLSQELRPPLNAILGWTDYLLQGGTDAANLHKGLQVIERHARAQSQWVEDLLARHRILSGALPEQERDWP
ncbi:response regulator [Herbaspirillum huttiense]|uniref:response regulator n=1 Tax=Herbaspirillum huttiense TaxID=863372 RepID=UPI0031D6CD54